MTTVRQVLQNKGSDTWSIPPEATVFQALQLMAEKDIGSVLVVDKDGKLAGIFSERDYARKVILKGRTSKNVTVGELMTSTVFTVSPDLSLQECMKIMTEHKIRHLPVLEGDRLAGMISIGDVVRTLLTDHEFTIRQLERYIAGPTYPEA